MANFSHGMNMDEVNQLGATLKQVSKQITEVINALNTKVTNTTWVGPDANRFKNEWWPGHRANLQKISQDLDGFGQSAQNNAKEQDETSRR